MRPGAQPPEAPTIAIQLIAAPAGERAPGVVQDAPPVPAPPPTAPARQRDVVTSRTPLVKPKPDQATPARVKPSPRLATATAPKNAQPEKTQAPEPTAGGGSEGGKGADVAPVNTEGVQFPWPYYTTNIVSRLIQRFGQMNGTLSAAVHFTIRRDGSVDPESIKLVHVRPEAMASISEREGAVEAAANAKEFGPLPSGFRDDILPVTMRFSPKVVR